MTKYLLFGGEKYYPCGGFRDFMGSFDSLEEAKKEIMYSKNEWFHIVNLDTFKIEYKVQRWELNVRTDV